MTSLVGPAATAGHTLGAGVLAAALKHHGVQFMFGVVGIPIVEVGTAAQEAGLQFVGFRNEQAASYAAGAASYLTAQPQACLVVSGPGVSQCTQTAHEELLASRALQSQRSIPLFSLHASVCLCNLFV